MAMGNVLQAAMKAASPQPAAMNPSPNPPSEGLPPAPTGIGAIPTGDPGTTAKGAADQAILSLREVLGFYPALGPDVQGIIDKIKGAAQAQSAKPKQALGQPSPLGTPPPEVPGPSLSGTPGAA